MRVWSMVLAASSGFYGAAGVTLAAIGAHAGAGPNVTTAAYFLLFHAAALVGACALAASRAGKAVLLAASLWVIGTLLFSGELALHALAGVSPVPFAAPTGGVVMIVGWLVASVALPLSTSARVDGRASREGTPPPG